MNRLARISAASIASIIVCATLGVGVWWMFSALPAPANLHDEPLPPSPPNDIPRQASIPWQRNPDVLQPVPLSPAWLPWQKPPKPLRRATSWWTPPPSLPKAPLDPAEMDDITTALKSPDSAQQDHAIARIEQIIHTNPLDAARQLAGPAQPWSAALILVKRWPDLDRLATELLIPLAFNTELLEALMFDRASAAIGHPDIALTRCRQWFAISSLRTTANVLAFTEQSFRRANPDNKQAARQFRSTLESPISTSPTTEPAFSMKLDPTDPDSQSFAAAANAIHAEDYASLLARANLYLLAARPDDAQRLFRRAYMLAPESQLPAATENFARVIKAKTASIHAANAWLQEHTK